MKKFIDLFCGIGGFRLALEKRGLECVFSSEIDAHAKNMYEANFGELPEGDITEIPSEKIPEHDILCAGFPCQSCSISGRHGGISDKRGQLFYEIVRIADFCKPGLLLLENVKNILSIDGGKVMELILKELDGIGYDVRVFVLNSSNFGIPQSRERVYFAALRKDIVCSDKLGFLPPQETNKKIYLEDMLDVDIDESLIIKREFFVTINECDVEHKLKPIRVGYVNKGGQGERIYSPKGHAVTQSAYGGGVGARTGLYATKQGIRRLSINECKKVMGFPEGHKVSGGTQGYKQLGNAVIPDMVGHVYEGIKEYQ